MLLNQFGDYLTTKGFSNRSIEAYLSNLKLFLDYLEENGVMELAQVDHSFMFNYQVSLLHQTYRGKHLSNGTKQSRLCAIRCFFQYLVKMEIAGCDPTQDLELPRKAHRLPRMILSKKEIGKLLAAPDLSLPLGIRDRAILEVFYSTGVRVTELINLALKDIDLIRGELKVNQGKGAKDRLIPLGEVACDYVRLYLQKARPKMAGKEENLLFVSVHGRKLLRSIIAYMIDKYTRQAGLKKHVSSHCLRHTCATHLLQGKADIRHIQAILGHNSLETTQIYTKVNITDLKKVHRRCHPRELKGVPVNDGWI
jgi:integrase/recombinase XerD